MDRYTGLASLNCRNNCPSGSDSCCYLTFWVCLARALLVTLSRTNPSSLSSQRPESISVAVRYSSSITSVLLDLAYPPTYILVKLRMDNFGDHNLPEMLARNLVDSEDVFLARSITAGSPAVNLASEDYPRQVSQRNPSRVATTWLHHANSETGLCSLQQDGVRTTKKHEREGMDKDSAFRHGPVQFHRRPHIPGPRNMYMKMETDKEGGRLFLNGLEEEWGSDSSVDFEGGLSSPYTRTRQQSVTTAATSVDVHSVAGGRVAGGCGSLSGSPESQSSPILRNDSGSWIDIEPRTLDSEDGFDRGIVPARNWEEVGLAQSYHPHHLAEFSEVDNRSEHDEQQSLINVPRRRSSLSHQVTTVILGETAHTPKPLPHNPTQELSSQQLHISPQSSSHQFPFQHPQSDQDETEAALSPVIPISRRQPYPTQKFHLHLNTPPPEQPSPSSISSTKKQYHDIPHHSSQQQLSQLSQLSQPELISKPRKSRSATRMPLLTQVHSWLESSGGAESSCPPTITPASPIGGIAPVTHIRVSTEVLENLRIMVGNFPDTMLRTSCLTVQTVRSYSRKLRLGDIAHERISPRGSDELGTNKLPSSALPPQGLDRKTSFGNLKLMTSFRGKLSSRFTPSPTSPSVREKGEEPWPPVDNRIPSVRCNSSPSRPSDSQAEPCITALRSIFPTGSDYLLDALYAHFLVYNYVNALCGGLPHLHQDGAGPHLRTQPSMNFVLPAGVTSLADLRLHEDSSETVVRDFHDDITNATSQAVVPSKAAAMLGLGSTNMGKPVKPHPGTLGGRKAKLRNTTPPAAAFTNSLESDAAMRYLREEIARNIYRLVETVKSPTLFGRGKDSSEEEEDGSIIGPNGRELDPTLMRAISEVVRCYEELNF